MGIFEGADNGGLLNPEPVSVRKRQAFWLAVTLLVALAWAFLVWATAYAAPGALSSCSGTVGVTSTAITFPASGSTGPSAPQIYIQITNPHATNTLWVNPTGAAAAANAAGSGMVSPGGYIWFDAGVQPVSIQIIASGADTPFTCWYK